MNGKEYKRMLGRATCLTCNTNIRPRSFVEKILITKEVGGIEKVFQRYTALFSENLFFYQFIFYLNASGVDLLD